MPIIQSAIKRAKQSLVRRSRNLQVKRAIKQDVNALITSIAAGEVKDIETKLGAAYSEIDRAVKKGTLHKNTAARRKSQLAHTVAKAAGAETVPAETKTTKGAGKKATAKTTTAKKAPVAKTTPVAKKAAAPKKPAAAKAPAKKTVAKADETAK